MPIFHNIDGKWIAEDAPPAVFDRTTHSWRPLKRVYARAQGRWRVVWPDPVTTQTIITVEPQDTTWPQPAMVLVSIGQLFPTGYLSGTVTVVSEGPEGVWQEQFPAGQQEAVFTLPVRSTGTYRVDATWSENEDVSGSSSYAVRAAVPMMRVEPGIQHTQEGQPVVCNVQLRLNGGTVPAGGFIEYRQQQGASGEFGPYTGTRPYRGEDTVFTIVAQQSTVVEFRFRDHPNVAGGTARMDLWVLQEITGIVQVQALAAATFTGTGTLRQRNYPVYHGWFAPGVHGAQRGLVWLPPLPSDAECTKVEIEWLPQQTYVKPPNWSRLAIGYHTLPLSAETVSYSDRRLREGVFEVSVRQGEPTWIELPEMANMLNVLRGEPCGIVLGHESVDPSWYGYGHPRTIRYHYRRWG